MTPSLAATRLARLAERFWQFECHEIPLFAVLAGETLPDAALFRESIADYQRRHRVAGELLGELLGIDLDGVSAQDLATYGLLHRELSAIQAHFEVDAHLRPSIFPAGLDFNTVYFANSTSLVDVDAAARYVERLKGIPAAMRDVQDNISAGYAKGMRYPRAVIASAVANTRGLVAGAPDSSAWYGPFKRSPIAENAAMRAQAARALAYIQDELLPAFQAYAEFLSGPTAADGRDTLSCTDGPLGREFYAVLVRHFTSTDDSPEQIHELGLREVDRIEAEVVEVAREAGFDGDAPRYRAFLASDPQFVAPTSAALRESMESLCKRIDRKLPAFFGRIPRITYGVDSIPEAMSSRMPPAYAQPGPADGSAAGLFWVSGIPAKAPSYLHVALAVHEAWPGHLMHIALMQEAGDLPAFRRHGAVKYTAYVEGWALYCETLAGEMGLYTTPHMHYGRLEMELWRAVRLVVDTGIHCHGWSRERAIDYMAHRLTLSREAIEAEVDRYAALPAQALAYQIGNLHMRALRRRVETSLGERFRHRSFHEAVMTTGAVTLPVLDGLIDDWLQRQIAAA